MQKKVTVITDKTYLAYNIKIFRQKAAKFMITAEGMKKVVYPVEPQAKIGPIYVKDEIELHRYERQIAYANRDMIGYDWIFEAEKIGVVSRKTMEGVGRPNNLTGFFCGECGKPTTQPNVNFCRQHKHRS